MVHVRVEKLRSNAGYWVQSCFHVRLERVDDSGIYNDRVAERIGACVQLSPTTENIRYGVDGRPQREP